ncbi:ABC transporter substrate-binding protein [Allorhizobium borbori]|jgi:putative spermidine/putrescine transport system substrate-binding protein/spermidine/putrescine transport system substrate-binding protein|uniref:Putative spermidine/putrescine transport system substrate-binding protein/spermidine/putrescine transport system substrate-binding protein n=1 Tax=Allorhizobium borbori TaxID=485907 RepID=A0A7W6K5C3_9HYPH|nr:ABC transporter substrate-binding protein [Allorhizobium borbori]MBB4105461.1 putative spermidine/putrescine transport system substrate-binding protein/spermidine/putrescine transport system substrate-binding protein [Allorhizobium borbori]PZU24557.1 MAG: ABC transporter substrate-binding protein [Shinella sp.]
MKIGERTSIYAALLGMLLSSGTAHAEGTLNLLTWEGYADPSYVTQFEKETGCKVNATYVGSNDDFAPKLMAGGGVYDLITPSLDTTKLMIDLDLVEPIDTAKIAEWNNIYPNLRALENIRKGDDVYGMPYTWGAIIMMYRTDAFKTPPTSISDLWNPELKGKISIWDDKSSIYLAARKNGDMNIYNLSDEQIAAARKALEEQKPLVRKYWTTAGELVDLYKSGEIVLSNTWAGNMASILKREGIPMTEFIPKEGAEGWVDIWMMVKGTPNTDCAYKYLNMQLSAVGQCAISQINTNSVANPVAAKTCMTPERFAELHQDDPTYLDKLMVWQSLGDRYEAYANAWNAVKAQ